VLYYCQSKFKYFLKYENSIIIIQFYYYYTIFIKFNNYGTILVKQPSHTHTHTLTNITELLNMSIIWVLPYAVLSLIH